MLTPKHIFLYFATCFLSHKFSADQKKNHINLTKWKTCLYDSIYKIYPVKQCDIDLEVKGLNKKFYTDDTCIDRQDGTVKAHYLLGFILNFNTLYIIFYFWNEYYKYIKLYLDLLGHNLPCKTIFEPNWNKFFSFLHWLCM